MPFKQLGLFLAILIFPVSSYAKEPLLIACAAAIEDLKHDLKISEFPFQPDYFESLVGIAMQGSSDKQIEYFQRRDLKTTLEDKRDINACYRLGVPSEAISLVNEANKGALNHDPSRQVIRCYTGLLMTIDAYQNRYGTDKAMVRKDAIQNKFGFTFELLRRLVTAKIDLIKIEQASLDYKALLYRKLTSGAISSEEMWTIYKSQMKVCNNLSLPVKEFQDGLE